MDEDDDSNSNSNSNNNNNSGPCSPAPPISVARSSAPNPHPSESVTVATPAPLLPTLTLALPIQGPTRDDCWSEGATSALIDAWGEHFLHLSRGNLKQKHWQEVAQVVTSREDYTKPPKTDVQCKNRIDTLKKKYKIEKSKTSSSSSSSWPFFNRLDFLLGPLVKTPAPSPAAVATAARSHFPQKHRTSFPVKRKASSPPPPPPSASSTSDSLPPADGRRRGAGMRELARAILKFGEVYQRVESSKLEQAVEMEKQRMGFARELEMQRMQFFMKTQMELSQLRAHLPASAPGGSGGGGGSNSYLHHSRRRRHQSAGNGNDNGFGG